MEDQIKNFPDQLSKGYDLASNTGSDYRDKNLQNIIIAGMGGSGLPGNILTFASEHVGAKVPIFLHKSYDLPHNASENSLVVVISYSGNTEEALSAYDEALRIGAPLTVIATGGKLLEKAKSDNIPVVKIPGGIQPRMAIGYQFSALCAVLSNAGLISSQNEALTNLSETLKAEEGRKKASEIAENIKGTTPIIYSSNRLEKISYILKIQINENAKQHAFYNIFPEMNHNELEAFETSNTGNLSVLFIRSSRDHERVAKRMELSAKLIEGKGYPVYFIDINKENWYSEVFSLILFGIWLAYELALKNNIEPEKVDLIEAFKKELN